MFTMIANRYTLRPVLRIWFRSINVLGIETSCDDTGIGVVTSDRVVLGEIVRSQQSLHTRFGGIIPPIAQDHHREHIAIAVNECLSKGNLTMKELDVVAVTNRPGLPMSLITGVRYAKYLCRTFKKPIIPVHHMQAHALVARLTNNVQFPFLCLLLSGGHCQLVFVRNANTYLLLGETIDDAPGETFDKVARMLKLHHISAYEKLSGGEAIEAASAESSASINYYFPIPLLKYNDCQFSFAGLKNNAARLIKQMELKSDIRPDQLIEYYREFCSSFLNASIKHICHRLQRAVEYCLKDGLFGETEKKSLVVAGGVASNDLLYKMCGEIAEHYQFDIYRPYKKYCRDNGVMIAWNGIEIIKSGVNWVKNIDEVEVNNKSSIGISLVGSVKSANLRCKPMKMLHKVKKEKDVQLR